MHLVSRKIWGEKRENRNDEIPFRMHLVSRKIRDEKRENRNDEIPFHYLFRCAKKTRNKCHKHAIPHRFKQQ